MTRTLAACTVCLCCAAAAAQSSSLFRQGEERGNGQAASSQPARASVGATTNATANAAPAVEPNKPLNDVSFLAVAPRAPRTFKVHDAVTVIVLENLRYRSDNQFQQNKRWDLEAQLSKWFRIHDKNWTQQQFRGGVPEVDLEMTDQRTGNGRQDRKDELTTRITAEVIDVKPNGQLVVQASRTIQYEEDIQTITLIGRCRGDDVTAANTLLSTQLIEPELRTKNEGKIRDAGKRGWLQRVFDTVRPF